VSMIQAADCGIGIEGKVGLTFGLSHTPHVFGEYVCSQHTVKEPGLASTEPHT
jgi:hypothetical protein